MVKPYVKRESPALSSEGLDKQRFRDELWKVVNQLNLKMPSAPYPSEKEKNNSSTFTPGSHKGFTPKEDDFIDSSAEAIISAEQTFTSVNRVNNLTFATAVNLTPSASVIFNGCRFNASITMENGAKAHFIGCMFRNNSFVNNAGVVANAYVIGCVKSPTATHINTTIIAQTDY